MKLTTKPITDYNFPPNVEVQVVLGGRMELAKLLKRTVLRKDKQGNPKPGFAYSAVLLGSEEELDFLGCQEFSTKTGIMNVLTGYFDN